MRHLRPGAPNGRGWGWILDGNPSPCSPVRADVALGGSRGRGGWGRTVWPRRGVPVRPATLISTARDTATQTVQTALQLRPQAAPAQRRLGARVPAPASVCEGRRPPPHGTRLSWPVLSLFWIALLFFCFCRLRSLSLVTEDGSQGTENARKGKTCADAALPSEDCFQRGHFRRGLSGFGRV